MVRDVNKDSLSPTKESEKNWKWFEVSNIWANDIQSLFGYTLVASLFISYQVTGWTAFSALIVAGLIVTFLVNISGKAGVDYGIPYPVLARSSMGIHGAKLSAIIRAVVAVFWFGVQTYFASTALHLLIVASTGIELKTTVLGLDMVGWFSFFVVWILQMVIFSKGMNWVSKFLNFAAPFVYLIMIGLLIVLWSESKGELFSAANNIFSNKSSTFDSEINGFFAIVGTMIAYFAAVMINFSDFSRYAKNKKSMVLGNLVGLPLNMIFFSALALLITAGSVVVFGEKLTNPMDIVEKADSTILSLVAAITFFTATVGINLVANFIPAVNGISNLAPKKLSFKKSGMITSAFALIIGGFWVSFISQVGISPIVNTLGATLAPLYGILIVDYFFIKKQDLDMNSLYDETQESIYFYKNGWNTNTMVAFVIGALFSICTVWVDSLSSLNGYGWIIGAVLGGFIYLSLSKYQTNRNLAFN
ncbi:NCS1 family nucleobase:cation symporter-1 [Halarcobacter anaerophilus]|uniref:Allantoin permease n=1 Tax=Halarcobacter anaerophilus TaxID=877500 RepID=A0A4Q0Y345_9BACT|nr:NCS1 family nucleobase:cation symporter-1 [Halarcobacter anaerophilus]QDF27539.1 allantoin permease [Halarcobacter anaerophilus]RXJ63895.1 allantoin permease [Halarcobacter anaerophilus]